MCASPDLDAVVMDRVVAITRTTITTDEVARFGRYVLLARRYVEAVTTFARQVDASGWPLVVLEPSRIGSDEALSTMTEALGTLLRRHERFCLLADFTDKTCMELSEVRHLTTFFRAYGEPMDEWVAAMGLVVPSAMVRGALRVIFSARPPGYPNQVFQKRHRAKGYLDPYLSELTVPEAVGH